MRVVCFENTVPRFETFAYRPQKDNTCCSDKVEFNKPRLDSFLNGVEVRFAYLDIKNNNLYIEGKWNEIVIPEYIDEISVIVDYSGAPVEKPVKGIFFLSYKRYCQQGKEEFRVFENQFEVRIDSDCSGNNSFPDILSITEKTKDPSNCLYDITLHFKHVENAAYYNVEYCEIDIDGNELICEYFEDIEARNEDGSYKTSLTIDNSGFQSCMMYNLSIRAINASGDFMSESEDKIEYIAPATSCDCEDENDLNFEIREVEESDFSEEANAYISELTLDVVDPELQSYILYYKIADQEEWQVYFEKTPDEINGSEIVMDGDTLYQFKLNAICDNDTKNCGREICSTEIVEILTPPSIDFCEFARALFKVTINDAFPNDFWETGYPIHINFQSTPARFDSQGGVGITILDNGLFLRTDSYNSLDEFLEGVASRYTNVIMPNALSHLPPETVVVNYLGSGNIEIVYDLKKFGKQIRVDEEVLNCVSVFANSYIADQSRNSIILFDVDKGDYASPSDYGLSANPIDIERLLLDCCYEDDGRGTFEVPECCPIEAEQITTIFKDEYSLHIEWPFQEGAENYRVRYRISTQNSIASEFNDWVPSDDGIVVKENKLELDELVPGVFYDFQVKALCKKFDPNGNPIFYEQNWSELYTDQTLGIEIPEPPCMCECPAGPYIEVIENGDKADITITRDSSFVTCASVRYTLKIYPSGVNSNMQEFTSGALNTDGDSHAFTVDLAYGQSYTYKFIGNCVSLDENGVEEQSETPLCNERIYQVPIPECLPNTSDEVVELVVGMPEILSDPGSGVYTISSFQIDPSVLTGVVEIRMRLHKFENNISQGILVHEYVHDIADETVITKFKDKEIEHNYDYYIEFVNVCDFDGNRNESVVYTYVPTSQPDIDPPLPDCVDISVSNFQLQTNITPENIRSVTDLDFIFNASFNITPTVYETTYLIEGLNENGQNILNATTPSQITLVEGSNQVSITGMTYDIIQSIKEFKLIVNAVCNAIVSGIVGSEEYTHELTTPNPGFGVTTCEEILYNLNIDSVTDNSRDNNQMTLSMSPASGTDEVDNKFVVMIEIDGSNIPQKEFDDGMEDPIIPGAIYAIELIVEGTQSNFYELGNENAPLQNSKAFPSNVSVDSFDGVNAIISVSGIPPGAIVNYWLKAECTGLGGLIDIGGKFQQSFDYDCTQVVTSGGAAEAIEFTEDLSKLRIQISDFADIYHISFTINDGSTDVFNSDPINVQDDLGSIIEVDVPGIVDGKEYTISILNHTSEWYSCPSPYKLINIEEVVECLTASNMRLEAISETEIKVDWDLDNQNFDAVRYFYIEYRVAGTNTYNRFEMTELQGSDSASTTSQIIDGLQPDTEYEFRINVICDDSNLTENITPVENIKTKEDIVEQCGPIEITQNNGKITIEDQSTLPPAKTSNRGLTGIPPYEIHVSPIGCAGNAGSGININGDSCERVLIPIFDTNDAIGKEIDIYLLLANYDEFADYDISKTRGNRYRRRALELLELDELDVFVQKNCSTCGPLSHGASSLSSCTTSEFSNVIELNNPSPQQPEVSSPTIPAPQSSLACQTCKDEFDDPIVYLNDVTTLNFYKSIRAPLIRKTNNATFNHFFANGDRVNATSWSMGNEGTIYMTIPKYIPGPNEGCDTRFFFDDDLTDVNRFIDFPNMQRSITIDRPITSPTAPPGSDNGKITYDVRNNENFQNTPTIPSNLDENSGPTTINLNDVHIIEISYGGYSNDNTGDLILKLGPVFICTDGNTPNQFDLSKSRDVRIRIPCDMIDDDCGSSNSRSQSQSNQAQTPTECTACKELFEDPNSPGNLRKDASDFLAQYIRFYCANPQSVTIVRGGTGIKYRILSGSLYFTLPAEINGCDVRALFTEEPFYNPWANDVRNSASNTSINRLGVSLTKDSSGQNRVGFINYNDTFNTNPNVYNNIELNPTEVTEITNGSRKLFSITLKSVINFFPDDTYIGLYTEHFNIGTAHINDCSSGFETLNQRANQFIIKIPIDDLTKCE